MIVQTSLVLYAAKFADGAVNVKIPFHQVAAWKVYGCIFFMLCLLHHMLHATIASTAKLLCSSGYNKLAVGRQIAKLWVVIIIPFWHVMATDWKHNLQNEIE